MWVRFLGREEALESLRTFPHVLHVLPCAQLSAWVKYLDFSEARGNSAATVTLYERCLVPCASYPGAFFFYMTRRTLGWQSLRGRASPCAVLQLPVTCAPFLGAR